MVACVMMRLLESVDDSEDLGVGLLWTPLLYALTPEKGEKSRALWHPGNGLGEPKRATSVCHYAVPILFSTDA